MVSAARKEEGKFKNMEESDGGAAVNRRGGSNNNNNNKRPRVDHDSPNKSKYLVDLEALNPLITCRVCNGYVFDAHVVTECMHSTLDSPQTKAFVDAGYTPIHRELTPPRS